MKDLLSDKVAKKEVQAERLIHPGSWIDLIQLSSKSVSDTEKHTHFFFLLKLFLMYLLLHVLIGIKIGIHKKLQRYTT